MNLISLVNTDIAPGQQTPDPTFQEDIHMKGESLSLSADVCALEMVIQNNRE